MACKPTSDVGDGLQTYQQWPSASNLLAMAANLLLAMASNLLLAMASNLLLAMASKPTSDGLQTY